MVSVSPLAAPATLIPSLLCRQCLVVSTDITDESAVGRAAAERSLESFDSPWVISHTPTCDANGIRGRL
jgi:hypothetical protein